MGRGSQSVQEMKARSRVLLPVHTHVTCVCPCTWMSVRVAWRALAFINVDIGSHVPSCCVSVHA